MELRLSRLGWLLVLVTGSACGEGLGGGSIDYSLGGPPTGSSEASIEVGALVSLPLDEGSGSFAEDASGNGNDGTLLNGASFDATTGDGSPSAVDFDGTNDIIDVGAFDVAGSGLTLAARFFADDFTGRYDDGRLISKATGIQPNEHVFMLSTIRSGSNVRLRGRIRVQGRTTTLIADRGNLVTGKWNHAALTYDGTTVRLYLDGVEVGSTRMSGDVDNDPSVRVAVGGQPLGAGSKFFDGLIDDIRIYEQGLTSNQVAQLVNSAGSPATPNEPACTDESCEIGATVLLPLDDANGTTVTDASGNGHDGALLNGASFEALNGDGSPYAVDFDGVDDMIDLGSVDVRGTGLTLAAWFFADSFSGSAADGRLISKATGIQDDEHVFMLSTIRARSAVRLRGRVRVGGSTTALIASTGNVDEGEWNHAALTYDGTTIRLYLNGQDVGSTRLSGTVDVDPSVSVAVGGQPLGAGSKFFDGLIDDVRIYEQGLTSAEVMQVFESGGYTEAPVFESPEEPAPTSEPDQTPEPAPAPEPEQTPELEPAPEPTPPASDGDRPWAYNTGPSNPGALKSSGSITIRTNGAVVEDVDVNGTIVIDADNVTVRNFRVAASSSYGIKVESGHRGIVIEDGEIFNMSSAAIFGAGFTARRLHIHDSKGDGIKAQGSGGPTLVEYCFIEKLGKGDGAHADGNQTRGGSNITFRYNNIYMPNPGTPNFPGAPYKSNATFILQLSISNFVIENNWLTGGNYTVYCSSGASVRNNIFGRENAGWPDKEEMRVRSGTCGQWSGNVWEDTGQPL
jgi:hypothetical protein